jgi:hypothetical protein
MSKSTKHILSSLNESILNVVNGKEQLDEAASDLPPDDISLGQLETQVGLYLANKLDIRNVKLNFVRKLNLKSPKPMEYDISSMRSNIFTRIFKNLTLRIEINPYRGSSDLIQVGIDIEWETIRSSSSDRLRYATLTFDRRNKMKLKDERLGF